MGGKQQKIGYSLALEPVDRGETPVRQRRAALADLLPSSLPCRLSGELAIA
jgi:hypothetical protein